jgi:hypothetical protein
VGGYVAKKTLDKVFGGRGPDKDARKPKQPSEPPPARTE